MSDTLKRDWEKLVAYEAWRSAMMPYMYLVDFYTEEWEEKEWAEGWTKRGKFVDTTPGANDITIRLTKEELL